MAMANWVAGIDEDCMRGPRLRHVTNKWSLCRTRSSRGLSDRSSGGRLPPRWPIKEKSEAELAFEQTVSAAGFEPRLRLQEM